MDIFGELNNLEKADVPKPIYNFNGCKIFLLDSNKYKTNMILFNFIDTLNQENAALNALLPYVLRRGSKSFPNMKVITEELQMCYGASLSALVDKMGDNHVLAMYSTFPGDDYVDEVVADRAIALLMSILFDPLLENGIFDEAYVEQEKNNMIARIESLKDDKMIYAVEKCAEEMCKDEPFGISEYGEVDAVKSITNSELVKAYERMINTLPVNIYIAGKFSGGTIDSFVETVSKSFEKRARVMDIALSKPSEALTMGDDGLVEKSEAIDVAQCKITMGFTTGITSQHEKYFPLIVANSIYGNGMHSKLFNVVREQESLAYYATSRVDKFKGAIFATAGIDSKNKEKTKELFLKLLQDVKDGEISDFEFSAAKKTLVNMFKALKDSQGSKILFYSGQLLAETEKTIDEIIDEIQHITLEQVVDAAQLIKPRLVYYIG